ncbi:MAG: TolC family protein [Fermentimonas sp.]|nr:TolC family protein [Fermentimonas sp.]
MNSKLNLGRINILLFAFILFSTNFSMQSQVKKLTIDRVIDSLSLVSPKAKIVSLNFQNELLLFENYKKSLLPALFINFNPINFNRSYRALQQPDDGSYSYVEDYSNNSSIGASIRQKIGFTGGESSINTNLNYLNEFSQKRNSFSTTPFSFGYSQQLRGSAKFHRLEKDIDYAKNSISIKQYCTNISQIQHEALNFFMDVLLNKMERELSLQNKLNNDTLQHIAKVKLKNGIITEFDFKQIELQSLNTQYAYEDATKKYVESQQRLITFLGINDDSIDIDIPVFELPLSIDTHLVATYVKKNNSFFKQQEIQELEAEKSLFSAKLSNRLNGTINLNYGINQYAETFIDAYRHGNQRQSLIIGFQIPVFQWGLNKNRIRIAENTYQASSLTIEKKILEFENEIKEKINAYNQSVKLWFTSEKAYELSQEQYQMLVQKFIMGKVSVYELTTAQNSQNIAMNRYYSAIRNSFDSYFSLRSIALYDFKQDVELEILFIDERK